MQKGRSNPRSVSTNLHHQYIYTVETVIYANPSRDLDKKVAYDRGPLIQSQYNDQ